MQVVDPVCCVRTRVISLRVSVQARVLSVLVSARARVFPILVSVRTRVVSVLVSVRARVFPILVSVRARVVSVPLSVSDLMLASSCGVTGCDPPRDLAMVWDGGGVACHDCSRDYCSRVGFSWHDPGSSCDCCYCPPSVVARASSSRYTAGCRCVSKPEWVLETFHA